MKTGCLMFYQLGDRLSQNMAFGILVASDNGMDVSCKQLNLIANDYHVYHESFNLIDNLIKKPFFPNEVTNFKSSGIICFDNWVDFCWHIYNNSMVRDPVRKAAKYFFDKLTNKNGEL